MANDHQMKPVRFDPVINKNLRRKTDPAFKEITEGLIRELEATLKDPDKLSISCCIEGCCVSWCCVQII